MRRAAATLAPQRPVVFEGEPTAVKLANGWIIINVGGGPTDDKPDVILEPPQDPHRTSSFLNIRVADIRAAYYDVTGTQAANQCARHRRAICGQRDGPVRAAQSADTPGLLLTSESRTTCTPRK